MEVLQPQESRWCQYIASILRRVQIPVPTYTVAPVQYTPQTAHPYYQQYGGLGPSPTFAVQEEQGWWDQTSMWGQQEAGYEWNPENYEGLLPIMEQ
jgi:hypothetical protein